MLGVKITVRHVVPNNNRRYGKQPACNTEEQRFFGHNLDGTGYLGCRLIAKFGGCLIFPKLRLDSTVLDLNRLGWRTIRVKSSKKSWRRLGTLKLGDCWNDGLNLLCKCIQLFPALFQIRELSRFKWGLISTWKSGPQQDMADSAKNGIGIFGLLVPLVPFYPCIVAFGHRNRVWLKMIV
jgi:hypothetical protein